MRTVLISALVTAALLATAPVTHAEIVVPDRHVGVLFALDGTLLYRRGHPNDLSKPWMRVVHRRRRDAAAMPIGARVSSIGRDRSGRVVAVVAPESSGDMGAPVTGWYLYDIARDRLRPLAVQPDNGCSVDGAAIWYRRLAYVERCGPTSFTTVVSHDGNLQRFRGIGGLDTSQPVLRGRSLLVLATSEGEPYVWRVLDRGRACPALVRGAGEEYGIWAGFGPEGLTWAYGGWDFSGYYTGLRFSDVDLSGRCQARPAERFLGALPVRKPVRAVAIDGRWLYYATHRAVHRRLLPRRGSTAPPRNDNFDQAVRLTGRLPLRAQGRVGYATRERHEPLDPELRRSVWFRFRAPTGGTLRLDVGNAWVDYRVFSGATLTTLKRVRTTWHNDVALLFHAVAGRPYAIAVATEARPNFDLFTLALSRATG